MSETIEMVITNDGTINVQYKDSLKSLVKDLDADLRYIQRASEVEWQTEGTYSGWAVRSHLDSDLAIRHKTKTFHPCVCIRCQEEFYVSKEGNIVLFENRGNALAMELKLFWELTGFKLND